MNPCEIKMSAETFQIDERVNTGYGADLGLGTAAIDSHLMPATMTHISTSPGYTAQGNGRPATPAQGSFVVASRVLPAYGESSPQSAVRSLLTSSNEDYQPPLDPWQAQLQDHAMIGHMNRGPTSRLEAEKFIPAEPTEQNLAAQEEDFRKLFAEISSDELSDLYDSGQIQISEQAVLH